MGLPGKEQMALIQRMGGALVRHDGAPLQWLAGRDAALAAAAPGARFGCHRDGETLAVVLGSPRIDGNSGDAARRLAELYRARGLGVLQSLRGNFALALVLADRGETLLATDRMGVRPLLYTLAGDTLVFGSTADAVNLHPAVRPEIDPQSLYNYVYFHMVPGPATIYRGLSRLPAGCYVRCRDGRVETGRYWNMDYREDAPADPRELAREFRALLRRGVARLSDGEAGAFLSGGTDSSTVAGIMTEVAGRPARTYSIGFDAEGYDEMAYARIAARHFGTRHHEYYVTPADVTAAIPKVADIYDQPFGNASAVPTYFCARLAAADGVETLLGGDGGDELFGGNARYARQRLFAYYGELPAALRKGLLEPLAGLPLAARIPPLRKLGSYIAQASLPMPARLESYNLLNRLGPERVFTADLLAQVSPTHPFRLVEETYRDTGAQSLINRMLGLDLKFTLADNDLPKVTRMCELAGLEAAFPMLDEDIVEFSARLSPEHKLKGLKLRHFFKAALQDFLPPEILRKKKHGFGLPFGVWLQDHQPLRELAWDSLESLKGRGIVQPRFIDELTSSHVASHAAYYGTMVWVLMMLELWFQRPRRLT
jgi:asparagine synthase (glutamine-hydrolysing)